MEVGVGVGATSLVVWQRGGGSSAPLITVDWGALTFTVDKLGQNAAPSVTVDWDALTFTVEKL